MTKPSESVAKKSATDNNKTQGAKNSQAQAAAAPADEATPTAAPADEATPTAAPADEATPTAAPADEATPTAAPADEATPTAAPEKKAAADKESESSVKTAAVENTDYFIDKPKPPVTFEREGVKYRLRGQVFHIKGTRITAAELVLPENKAILDKAFEIKSEIIQEVFE